MITRRNFVAWTGAVAGVRFCPALGAESVGIAPQPFFASVTRAIAALAAAGQPMARVDADALAELARKSDAAAVAAAEAILNRYTLARVELGSDGYGSVAAGDAPRILVEQGWRVFLVRVSNPIGSTDRLDVAAGTAYQREERFTAEQRTGLGDTLNKVPGLEKKWLLSRMQAAAPLSGMPVEYQSIELFSRDRGVRSAKFGFRAGSGPNVYNRALLASYRNAARSFDFNVRPSRDVTLSVLDSDGVGCMASLTIKDKQGHVYPPQVMRLAPDMVFQAQIYRANGETVRLPDGEYEITSWRGPEYLRGQQTVRISDSNRLIEIKLQRWIEPAKWGWYSGDTHIHAAGCAHYMNPTEGVAPETLIRHVRGEALSIGNVLTWGPAWYYQKQYFSGQAISPEALLEHPELQAANNTNLKTKSTLKDDQSTLRYDVEVSGFPSSSSGHLVLLRLKEQDYPGTRSIEDWPTWNLPILRWARAQNAVAGYAHCALGMIVPSTELPNDDIPPFDSIGTNEAIVDVTHDACDFLSGCNGPPVAELNAWYHMLNCGFRLPMVGETDYPCLVPSADSRPGIGRSYVRLDQAPVGDGGYDAWIDNLRRGRLYWGDGRSHFLKFAVNGQTSGGGDVNLERRDTAAVEATIAVMLEPERSSYAVRNMAEEPWHIEHARIGKTRRVQVELVVNGMAVDKVEFLADGASREVRFMARIERSSWVALRVLGSGHTYPVFVVVAGKPIRASRRSAQWLRNCVDALWNEKHRLIRDGERSAAAEAYDHARRTYERITAESEVA